MSEDIQLRLTKKSAGTSPGPDFPPLFIPRFADSSLEEIRRELQMMKTLGTEPRAAQGLLWVRWVFWGFPSGGIPKMVSLQWTILLKWIRGTPPTRY